MIEQEQIDFRRNKIVFLYLNMKLVKEVNLHSNKYIYLFCEIG